MAKHILNRFLVVSILIGVSGCASIIDGSTQSVSVESAPDANCTLQNSKGVWYQKAPGSVSIHRSYDAVTVTCRRPGFDTAITSTQSDLKGMFFGNLLFGGLIGMIVDLSDGSAFDYPQLIVVPMQPTSSLGGPVPVT